jgi:hypothetical protein
MSWLGRASARLLPAARRDWAKALWAEADEVPAGWERLAWRAGGVRLIAREARLARRTGVLLLVAAAAWAAWPASAAPLSHGAVNQGDVIITIALLAGLPLLARRPLGPPASRAARWLRCPGRRRPRHRHDRAGDQVGARAELVLPRGAPDRLGGLRT